MRNVLLAFGLACLASATHATTIDFEEFAAPASGNGAITSQGFTLTSTGSYFPAYVISNDGSYGWCPDCTLTLEHSAGDLFSISSVTMEPGGSFLMLNSVEVTGYLAGGGTVQQTIYGSVVPTPPSVRTFGSEWMNLERVVFGNIGSQSQGQYIDDIVVTAVPVPPAIWLFASALLGLMRLRKGQRAAQ